MLIISADDLGRKKVATNNSLICYKETLITSASAMVFMADSQRAAALASKIGLETGLHLNLSEPFDGPLLPARVQEYHLPVVRYFRGQKLAYLLYNPFLKKNIDYVFKAQYNEYYRLFNAEPIKIDGHHHMHLCMNIILGNLIPAGMRIRRNFTFEPGEKSLANRTYRKIIDAWLVRRYKCADSFFTIKPFNEPNRLRKIIRLALLSNVELMVHPANTEEFKFLMSNQYREVIDSVPRGTFHMIA